MGCDIHGWIEKKVGDKYIAINRLKNRSRNYRRFAMLAGVRDYHNESSAKPLGIPDDISESAKYDIEQWDCDGHSHSYLSVKDAAKIFNETSIEPTKWPELVFFNVDDEDIDDTRLVFWFDN